MQASTPFVKDIVLIGGGHSHALLIRKWAMQPTPGIRITLISPNTYTPYSGMLPGLIAEHYDFSETHIDLVKLCAWAGVRFIQDEVLSIQGKYQKIQFKNRPDIEYDVCSIDIGSTPNQSIAGSVEFAVGVKPIAKFYQKWQSLQTKLKAHPQSAQPLKIVIIGAGAGGIELISAMQFWANKHKCNAQFHLINRADALLDHASSVIRKKLTTHLHKSNITCIHDFNTQKIDASYIYSDQQKIPYDHVFYCTQAAPAPWLTSTDIELTNTGFIKVNQHLQSISHNNIFAAGDVAHFTSSPLPKAGVYAVRMSPILLKNIVNLCLKKPLVHYRPQKNFLSLLALGEKYALGQKNILSIWGSWTWKLKNHIDKTFMNLFHDLPSKKMQIGMPLPNVLQAHLITDDPLALTPRCGGCGGKISSDIIKQTIQQLQPYQQAGILEGIGNDAAVLEIPNNLLLVQSLDHLKVCISDPYLFGKISALHALSDLFAMYAQPHSALTLLQLPNASTALQKRDMLQLMQGAIDVLNNHHCALIGGHTSENTDLQLGFCVNGTTKTSPQEHAIDITNHAIILTKPLGTGVILAAHMQAKANGEYVEHALDSMLISNSQAAQIFEKFNASYLTDVTGFGLVGHLLELIEKHNQQTNNVAIHGELTIDDIPALPGALTLFSQGLRSSLHHKNQKAQRAIDNGQDFSQHKKYPLLFDPQTSGGLLAFVPAEQAIQCLSALQQVGYTQASIIGVIRPRNNPALIQLLPSNS